MSDYKLSEFECPLHGRFEAMVPRADDPDEWPCPFVVSEGEQWDEGRHDDEDVVCDESSPWRISAPALKFPYAVAAVRGKTDPPPSPYYMPTELLADGEPEKYEKQRAKVWQDHREAQIRKAVS